MTNLDENDVRERREKCPSANQSRSSPSTTILTLLFEWYRCYPLRAESGDNSACWRAFQETDSLQWREEGQCLRGGNEWDCVDDDESEESDDDESEENDEESDGESDGESDDENDERVRKRNDCQN